MHHVNRNLIDEDESQNYLPVPVYLYIKPTMGVQFLLHIMLSMGWFSTDIDLTMHTTIHESLRYAQFIGSSNDP